MKRRLLLLIAASCTNAWGAAPGDLPDALKGVKAATGMCLREEVRAAGAVQSGAMAAADRIDPACGISVRELVSLSAKEALTLIDVRGAAAHADLSIDGALAMPAAAVQTKTFLQRRSLVLIGDGKGQRDLMAACVRLKSQGFVRPLVLLGGMPAWIAQRQPVVGRIQIADEPPRLTTSELWLESRFDANVIVVAEPLRALQQHMPGAVVVADPSPLVVKKIVESRLTPHVRAFGSIVVAVATAPTAEQMRAWRDAAQPHPILVFVGTPDTFAKDMQRQAVVWEAHAKGPKQPGCGL